MSSLVANKLTGPASGDVTDVDDGNATVTAGAFWPEVSLKELRLAARIYPVFQAGENLCLFVQVLNG